MRPHRQQPTRLPRPWDSPGKNTGVGCHFLLQCMKLKSESEVDQSCPTLCNPMDCSLPGSSVHGILYTLSYLNFTIILLECYYLQLINEDTETQRGEAVCLRSHSLEVVEGTQIWGPGCSDSKASSLLNITSCFSALVANLF